MDNNIEQTATEDNENNRPEDAQERKRRLTRLRVQRHREKASEAQKEARRIKHRQRQKLARQQECDIRRSDKKKKMREHAAKCRDQEITQHRYYILYVLDKH